jgi:dienelactone hydrolase
MKRATALLIGALSAACAGSDADPIVEPITQPPVGFDSCAVARPDFGGPATQAELSLFAYDVNAPLNLQKTVETGAGAVEVSAISYDSPAGGRVTGLLFIPRQRSTPRPGIILMHGSPGRARDFAGYATTLANYGAVVIAIDAPFARRSGPPLRMTKQDRDEQIQLMKDLQRAVDVLRAQPDVDKDRIAYLGISFGGAAGVQFAGIERRIKAAALVVADAGLVTHTTQTGNLPFLATLSCATRAAWYREMVPIEAIRFIGLAKGTPLLFQNGQKDEFITPADAQSLHNAAPEPKKIIWYDAGHNLTPQAPLDTHDWLVQQIGLDPR